MLSWVFSSVSSLKTKNRPQVDMSLYLGHIILIPISLWWCVLSRVAANANLSVWFDPTCDQSTIYSTKRKYANHNTTEAVSQKIVRFLQKLWSTNYFVFSNFVVIESANIINTMMIFLTKRTKKIGFYIQLPKLNCTMGTFFLLPVLMPLKESIIL